LLPSVLTVRSHQNRHRKIVLDVSSCRYRHSRIDDNDDGVDEKKKSKEQARHRRRNINVKVRQKEKEE
jgi:hypothetical protein